MRIYKETIKKTFKDIINFIKYYSISWEYIIYIPLIIILIYKSNDLIGWWVDKTSSYTDLFFRYLKDDNFLNRLISIPILIVIGILFYRRKQNRNITIVNIFICVLLFVYVIKSSPYYAFYSTGIWGLTYDMLLVIFLILYIGLLGYAFYRQAILYFKQKKEITMPSQDVGWDVYIEVIKTRIHNITTQECFAIGIANEWGSGKTTFLKQIEHTLERDKEYYIINFNPWNSHSEDKIIIDFFNTVKESLSPFYRGLEKPINKYAQLLTDLELNKWTSKAGKILSKPEENLSSLKLDVQRCLKQLDKRVIILIDDLDRLNGREIMEVFKLIRSSAGFENVVYLVTYDKTYVCSAIDKIAVYQPQIFIEKLFNIEITLPKFEIEILKNMLEEQIIYKIRKLNSEIPISQNLLPTGVYRSSNKILSGSIYYLSYEFLKTFRSVERFSEMFSLSVLALYNRNLFNETYLQDLFWIEIIRYSNIDLYNSLANYPIEILQIGNEKFAYSFDKISQNTREKYKIEKENSFDFILKVLFEWNRVYNGIDKYQYFDRYFSFRPMSNQIPLGYFISKIKASDEDFLFFIKEESVFKFNSLLYNFEVLIKSDFKDEVIYRRYILGLIELCLMNEHAIIVLKKALNKENVSEKYRDMLNRFIKWIFRSFIFNSEKIEDVSNVLCGLYGSMIPYSDYGYDGYYRASDLIISNDDIEHMSKQNYKKFPTDNIPDNIRDFFDSNKPINRFIIKNIKVCRYTDPSTESEVFDCKNLIYEAFLSQIIQIFNNNTDNRAILGIFDYEIEYDSYYSEELEEDLIKDTRNEIKKYFNNTSNYKDLLDQHSKIEKEKLSKYYNHLGIK